MPGFRDLARNHDFTVLWVGTTISELGSAMSSFAFPLVAYALTRSAVATSLAETAYFAGSLAMLLPAGMLADRHDRRLLMRVSAGSGAILFASLVAAGLLHALSLPHLLAVALLSGAASGLFLPAESAAVRLVLSSEELPTALAQQQARQHTASLLGAPIGGLLFALARWVPFCADAASYAANWWMLGRMRTDLAPRGDGAPRERGFAPVVAGWRFMFGHPFFRVLGISAPLANLTVNAVFFVAILRLIQAGYPAWQIGLVETSSGIFGILGSLAAPAIIARLRTGALLVVISWSFVPLLVPMALWNTPWVVGAAIAVGIFVNPAGNAGISAYAQTLLPRELLGRFSATMNFTSRSLMPLAPILAGGLLAGLGGRTAVLALAVPIAVVALIPTLSRAIWAIPRPAQWQGEEPVAVS